MAVLFPAKPGYATALTLGPGDLGLPIIVDGIKGSWFPAFKAILTEFAAQMAGNNQFTHTFKNVIYAYSFGDRISQIRVGGIGFAGACNNSTKPSTGLEATLDFYRKNRMAVRAKPIQIQIGALDSGRFRGYLTDFQPSISRPESGVSQFAFVFKVIGQ